MAMNTGTKLMLGLGTIGIVVGILVMILGAGSAGDAVNWRPTDDVYLENSQGETVSFIHIKEGNGDSICLLYTSPSPRDKRQSRMPSSA